MTRSPFNSAATAAVALLITIVVLDSATSQAVTPQRQQNRTVVPQKQVQPKQAATTASETSQTPFPSQTVLVPDPSATVQTPLPTRTFAAQTFVATAYSLRGRTASGQHVRRGIIAADRRVLPLGTRVRLTAGSQSGEYLVADTGGAIRGRKIDIWVPNTGEAMRFGRRKVQLTVLEYPRAAATRPRRVRKIR